MIIEMVVAAWIYFFSTLWLATCIKLQGMYVGTLDKLNDVVMVMTRWESVRQREHSN